MKTISPIILFVLFFCFLSGCRTLNVSDFRPSNSQLSNRLPELEPMIDHSSFDVAYNKIFPNQGMYHNIQQFYTCYWMNDASRLFFQDVKTNIYTESSENNGFIIGRIVENKPKLKGMGWFVLGAGLAGVPHLIGLPIFKYQDEIFVEVEIRNIRNEIVNTYRGNGKFVATNGFYYGFKVSDYSFFRKPIIEAIKKALDEVKRKIAVDNNSLTLALNKCMDELRRERLLSSQQSMLEPNSLLNGNKKFDEQDYSSSIDLYNSVLEEYPYHTYAMLNRARAKMELGDNSSAITDLSRIIELDPKNDDAFYYRGEANSNLLEPQAAIYNYNKTIELSPDNVQAYLMKAAAEEDLSLNSNAIDDYKKVLSLNPNLVYAKERINVVKERIDQHIAQQQQLAEQDRINRLDALNASLNILTNTLNNINATTARTTTNNTSLQIKNTNGHLVKEKCSFCKGTGVDPYPTHGATFGLSTASDKRCEICGKYDNHYHKKCSSCQGKGYKEKFVP